MRLHIFLLATFLLGLVPYTQAASFTVKLVKVIDGDTIEIMHDGKAERVRLAKIDCPEQG
jgi:endonuclease YncB( thermonuclease family)